jgi:hypothetical protein
MKNEKDLFKQLGEAFKPDRESIYILTHKHDKLNPNSGKFETITETLKEGTELECLMFLQRYQGHSYDWATKYEGYKLTLKA